MRLNDVHPSGLESTHHEKHKLEKFFGKTTCRDDFGNKFFDLFAVPIVLTTILIILAFLFYTYSIGKEIPSLFYRGGVILFLFFALTYIVDRIMVDWRKKNPICRYN